MAVPPAAQLNPLPLYRRIDIPYSQFTVSKDGFPIPLTREQIALYEVTLGLKRKALKPHIQIQTKEVSLKQLLGQPQVHSKARKPVEEMSAQEVELMYKMVQFQNISLNSGEKIS